MGELLDSSDEQAITPSEMRSRTESYVQEMGGDVAIWEVGNEVNGNWTGSPTNGCRQAGWRPMKSSGGRREDRLTLYENDFGPDHCGDGESELTPTQFTDATCRRSRHGLDYVCSPTTHRVRRASRTPPTVAGGVRGTPRRVPARAARLWRGGVPRPASRRRSYRGPTDHAVGVLARPRLPYYAGGYFWWYGAQDALRKRAPLGEALGTAFEAEAAALL